MLFNLKLKIALVIVGKLLLMALIWGAFFQGHTQNPSPTVVLRHLAPTDQGEHYE